MRYSFFAAALSLAVSGLAIADDGQQTGGTKPAQPAQPSQPSQPPQSPQDKQPSQSSETPAPQPIAMFFKTDSAELSDSATGELQELATWARCHPKAAVILEGHADTRGTRDHNIRLSGQRAAVVRQKLIGMGVPSDHIVVTVFGETGPRKPTLAQERRVTARAVERPVTTADLSG